MWKVLRPQTKGQWGLEERQGGKGEVQKPTYLTAGEQQGDAAYGPQGQVQVLHHRGCRERDQQPGISLYANFREARGQANWGYLLF